MNGHHKGGSGLLRSQLAEQTGCNLETIRYYEKIGLMPDPPRTEAGHRRYDDTHVRRLRSILRARDLGFPIDEIRSLFELVDDGSQTCAVVKERTERHLKSVREKIRQLRRVEKVLAETASQCTGDEAPECAVLDALAV